MVRVCRWLSSAALFLPAVAVAQTTPPAASQGDPYHDEAPPEIVVTAPFARNQADILSGTSVLTGQEQRGTR